MLIDDGKGRGYKTGVSKENQMLVKSISTPLQHHNNHHDEDYYTLTINKQANDAGDCIGYIKNNHSTKDLGADAFYVYSTTGSLVTIKINDVGTPYTPTTITPVNCNAGSGKSADCTCYEGTDLGNSGADLSGGDSVLTWYVDGVNGKLLNFPAQVILPKNYVMTFYSNQNDAPVIIGVGMTFHDKED